MTDDYDNNDEGVVGINQIHITGDGEPGHSDEALEDYGDENDM